MEEIILIVDIYCKTIKKKCNYKYDSFFVKLYLLFKGYEICHISH